MNYSLKVLSLNKNITSAPSVGEGVFIPVPISAVGCHGRMELVFAQQEGRTILRHAFHEVPFKITRLLNGCHASGACEIAHLILMHSTAGLFGGDELDFTIRVEAGARVRITQQAASRIHPSRDLIAIQRCQVHVAAGAELQLFFEPVIPFARSRYRQITFLDVEPGASLSYWEGFMAGRVSRGETWQFHEFASETTLHLNQRLAYLDRFRLNPSNDGKRSIVDPLYCGSGLYVGPRAAEFARQLHTGALYMGVDEVLDGLAVTRCVASSGTEFHGFRDRFCSLAAEVACVGAGGEITPTHGIYG